MAGNLGEVALVPRRGERDHIGGRSVERVGKTVGPATRCEDGAPGVDAVIAVAQAEPQATGHDEEGLVVVVVDVLGGAGVAGIHAPVDDRQCTAGVIGADLDEHRPPRQLDRVALSLDDHHTVGHGAVPPWMVQRVGGALTT